MSSCVCCAADMSSAEASRASQMQGHTHAEMCPQRDLFKLAGHVCFSFRSLAVWFHLQWALPLVCFVRYSPRRGLQRVSTEETTCLAQLQLCSRTCVQSVCVRRDCNQRGSAESQLSSWSLAPTVRVSFAFYCYPLITRWSLIHATAAQATCNAHLLMMPTHTDRAE